MTSDFGVTAGHVEYSNRRFDFDTRHMVMIEVYRHTEALEQFDYELPVYDRNEPYRARLYLSEDVRQSIGSQEPLYSVVRLHTGEAPAEPGTHHDSSLCHFILLSFPVFCP